MINFNKKYKINTLKSYKGLFDSAIKNNKTMTIDRANFQT